MDDSLDLENGWVESTCAKRAGGILLEHIRVVNGSEDSVLVLLGDFW